MASEIKDQIASAVEKFRELNDKITGALASAITKSLLIIEREAKTQVSRGRDQESIAGAPPRVDTGLLRASITHRLEDNKGNPEGFVGTNVPYGADLEYGTSINTPYKGWPHPWLFPSYKMHEKEIIDLMKAALKKETEAAGA